MILTKSIKVESKQAQVIYKAIPEKISADNEYSA